MPSGKGPLRIATDDFIETNPLSKWVIERWKLVKDRSSKAANMIAKAREASPALSLVSTGFFYFARVVYVLTGDETALDGVRSVISGEGTRKLIQDYARLWKDMVGSYETQSEFQVLGALFAEPILSVFGGLQRLPSEDPDEYLRRIYGVVTAAVVAPGIFATVAEVSGAGQVESVAEMLRTVVDTLGLSQLTGRVGDLYVSAGIGNDIKRSLNNRYRPNRFSASEIRDLYALSELDQRELQRELREDGWREQDISKWIRLAFRNVGEGDVWQLWKRGELSEEEVVRRLRATGYDPKDIPLLFKINQRDDVADAITVGQRTIREGYREHVFSKAEFVAALKDMAYSDRDIALLVALEDAMALRRRKSLSIAQVKSAWTENVLSDPEAIAYLKKEEFQDAEIAVILEEWRAEVAPKFVKLNRGTITGAYVEGVLDRPAAVRKLTDVGLSPDDARLELDLAEARNPEAFGRAQPKPPRALTYSTLVSLLEVKLITLDQMRARLVEADYTPADAALLTENAHLMIGKQPRPLTQAMVESAYVAGVLDRTRAGKRMLELGFDTADAEIVLQTIERDNPAVFAPETLQSVRLPSVGVIVEAYRNGILDVVEYHAQMQELGYTLATADLYAVVATQQERKKVKTLTPTQTANAYGKNFIPREEAMRRLAEQGYNEIDADLLLRFEKAGIEETDVWGAALAGLVGWEEAMQQLLSMGFTLDQIQAAIKKMELSSRNV
jgi:hypothetical protein